MGLSSHHSRQVLAALRHPDESAAMAVVPFLHAYIAKLKTSLKRTGKLTATQVQLFYTLRYSIIL